MLHRKRSGEDFAEEIKAHLEMEAEDLKGEGLSGEEARRLARAGFGMCRSSAGKVPSAESCRVVR